MSKMRGGDMKEEKIGENILYVCIIKGSAGRGEDTLTNIH